MTTVGPTLSAPPAFNHVATDRAAAWKSMYVRTDTGGGPSVS